MRNIDPVVLSFLQTRKPYSYAHLIKFERPIISPKELNTSERQYVYLTDASIDLNFNDPRVDASAPNLAIKYRANRILEVPAIQEYSKARATSLDLRIDGAAIGTTLADAVVVSSAGTDKWNILFTYPVYNKGIVEGDKIDLDLNGTIYKVTVSAFPTENTMQVAKIDTTVPTGSFTLYIELISEELVAILQDKASAEYASFINREVYIYKIYFNEETNTRVGAPYLIYKGIIQDVSLDDQDDSLIVNWTLNSHWGDFAEVKGRITSDEYHRALDERGIPQPESAIKAVYATDKGFIHADTAVHLEATYSVQIEKQDVKYKKGFFGIGAKVKVKKYFVPEDRQTELDFSLQGKTLDVIYGVRPAEGTPIFADTLTSDSNEIYVAYTICEGEIAGLYDVIIQDKSLICNNKQDFDTRSTQNTENTIDVLCYGRADRGDVLSGLVSTTTTYSNFYGTNYNQYANDQSFSYLINSYGYSQPLSTSAGQVGVLHENSIRLTSPISMTIDFYGGKPNQRAAPNLVERGQAGAFKVQNDYWTGQNKMEYWGPNHRLLDTAYTVVHYTIGENETTIPSIKMVVKGKFINCYNYDWSYQHYEKASGEADTNFNIGDLVNIYQSGTGTLLNTNLRIIDKFNIRNAQGVLEPRFRFSAQPALGYTNGVPIITKFYMQKSGLNWTMVTFNYVEASGTLAGAQTQAITSVTNASGAGVINMAAGQTIMPWAGYVGPDAYTHFPAMGWR